MKKVYIAIAVLTAATLISCEQEKSFNDHTVGKNEVAFVLQGNATRSAVLEKGISVPIGRVDNTNIYLEETVSYLDAYIPETKGTPVYTENVGKLYKNDLSVTATGFGDAIYETMDNAMVNGGWRFHHDYSGNKWPTDGSAVQFYLHMPSDMSSLGVSNITNADEVTTFSYTSKTTASAQKDIIFGEVTVNEKTHKDNLPNGTPVILYHALTAVKFAIGNTADELKSVANGGLGIVVTGITFTGLKNSGTCTVTPNATDDTPIVSWEATAAENNVISQTYTSENIVTFDKDTDKNSFADSYFNGGTSQNINDDKASLTFWLIPQDFKDSDAVLRISYTMSGKEEYMDLNLGTILKNVEWKAGQLRTYTIKFDEVNIKIEDTVKMGTGDEIVGGTKEAVKITNTGNVDVFIRAAIVGQWLDKDNNPVFGFTDNINFLYEVESWYEDQFVKTTAGTHGKFYDLAGYKGASTTVNGWFYNEDDQYYYYTEPVAPDGVTTNLFSKYEILKVPHTTNAGEVLLSKDMYFVLEVASQAISARKRDGTLRTDYMTAWTEALAFGEEE